MSFRHRRGAAWQWFAVLFGQVVRSDFHRPDQQGIVKLGGYGFFLMMRLDDLVRIENERIAHRTGWSGLRIDETQVVQNANPFLPRLLRTLPREPRVKRHILRLVQYDEALVKGPAPEIEIGGGNGLSF